MVETKVFVSSTLEELKKERKWAKEVIEKEMGLEPVLFEKEPAASEHLEKWWRDKIRDSKFYVLILGNEMSAPVFDEFQTAVKYSKKILILVKNEDLIKQKKLEFKFNAPPEEKEIFYKRIASRKYKPFKNKAELKDNIREGVVQYLNVPEDIDREFHHRIVSIDDQEYKKIDKVYVKPKAYPKAYETIQKKNIIILYGPPHVGKTITARKLAIDLIKDFFLDRILELEPTDDLARLRNIENSVIFIDDAFRKKSLEHDVGINRVRSIENLSKNNNYFILTSTRGLLLEAKKETKLETEFLIENHLVELGENDYTEEDLKEILKNHLLYHKVVKEKRKWILHNAKYIVNRLNFPHNIEFFVRSCLPDIKDKGSLIEGVKRAKTIELAVKNWFLKLDPDTKYFLITMALFGEFDRKKYSQLLKSVKRRHGNLDMMKKVAEPYVIESTFWEKETIKFRHKSYRDGILQGILEWHWEEVKKFLLNLIKTTEDKLRLGIDSLMLHFAMSDSRKVVKTLKSWAKKETKVRRVVAESLVFVSMEAPDEIFQLAKELLKDDDGFIKIRCIMTIGGIGQQRPFEALEIFKGVLLSEKNKNIQHFVEIPLNRIYRDNPDKVLPKFKDWIECYPELKINIARAIAQNPIDDEGIYELLRDFMLDTDEKVAEAAVFALRGFPGWTSWKIFNKLKKDENPRVRIAVLKALQSLDTTMFPPEHYGELISFIEDARQIAEELENNEDINVKTTAKKTIEKLNEQIEWAKKDLDQFSEELEEQYDQIYLYNTLDEARILALGILDDILVVLDLKKAKKEIDELKEYIRKHDENFYENLIKFIERSKRLGLEPIMTDDIDLAVVTIKDQQKKFEEKASTLLDSTDMDYISAVEKYLKPVYEGLRKLKHLGLIDKIE